MVEMECKELRELNLNTIEELHELFPHWKRSSVQKKLSATFKNKDKRFVTIIDGKIIGHVRVVYGKGLHAHRIEVTSLIVHPKYRRQGVATCLMDAAISSLPKKRSLAILAVDSKNTPALNLYKKLGFKEYGLLKNASMLNGKMVDNCLFMKELK